MASFIDIEIVIQYFTPQRHENSKEASGIIIKQVTHDRVFTRVSQCPVYNNGSIYYKYKSFLFYQ